MERTVFVIGAGASCELDLPDGNALKKIIAKKVNIKFDSYEQTSGDKKITEILKKYVETKGSRDINPYRAAGVAISEGIEQEVSIDNFLKSHSDNKHMLVVGKIAIAMAILEAEKNSRIYKTENISNLNSWHRFFFMHFFSGLTFDEALEKLRYTDFIIFNYDRCLEHHIFNAFKLKHGLNDSNALKVFENLNVIHPYGHLGDLPMQLNTHSGIEFGCESSYASKYLEISQGISTFNEEVEEENLFTSTKNIIKDASKIIFLGFAFHEQNMNFLKIETTAQVKDVYATAFNVSRPNISIAEDKIKSMFPKNKVTPQMYEGKCIDFFKEYSGIFSTI